MEEYYGFGGSFKRLGFTKLGSFVLDASVIARDDQDDREFKPCLVKIEKDDELLFHFSIGVYPEGVAVGVIEIDPEVEKQIEFKDILKDWYEITAPHELEDYSFNVEAITFAKQFSNPMTRKESEEKILSIGTKILGLLKDYDEWYGLKIDR